LSSSSAGALVNFSAGTKDVFITYPSGESVYQDGSAIKAGSAILAVPNGGTGAATLTGYVKGTGTAALTASATIPVSDISGGTALTKTDDTNVTLTLGGSPTTALLAATSITAGWTGQLAVSRGGTGASALTLNGVLYGNHTSAISATAAGTTGQVLVGNTGAAPSWATLTGIGVTSFSAGTTGLTPSTATTGAITLAGTLNVANGGTGATSLTSGYLLKGNGTSAVSASVVYDDGTNVGIGTASPTVLLDVFSATAANLSVRGNSATNITAHRSSTDATGPNLVLRKSRGTSASQTAVATGDNMGTLVFSAYGGANNRNIATIASNVEYYVSDSLLSSNLIFSTTSTSTTPTEAMRIDGSGNVGIATASPGAKLDVVAQNAIRATGSQPFLTLRDSSDSNKGSRIQTASGATLFSNDSTGGGTYAERMRIDASGNVGIATSTPQTRFEVYGGLIAGSENRQTHPNANAAGGFKAQWNYSSGSAETDLYNLYSTATESFRFYQTTGSGTAQILYSMLPTAHLFYTGGSERMRIDSSGNVGIGTSSPGSILHAVASGAELRAQNTNTGQYFSGRVRLKGPAGTYRSTALVHGNNNAGGTNTYFALEGADSSDNYIQTLALYDYASQYWGFSTNSSEKMRIDSSGNVGIGTSAPANLLEVRGAVTTTFSPNVYNTVLTGTSSATSGNAGCGISFRGYTTGSSTISDVAFVSGIKENTTDGNYAGALIFGTRTNGSGGGSFERMRIDSSGNVGIGTSSPQGLLHVVAGTNDTLIFRGPINLGTGGSIYAVNSANSAVTPMEFGASTYYFAGGNVGIGTSSPSQKLTLQGAQLIIPSAGWSSGQVAYMYLGDTNNGVSATNGSYQTYFSFNGHNWLVNGTEAMRIDGSRSVGIGTTTPQCIFNVKTGTAWVQNYSGSAASPSETVDWPVPAITATSYGNYTLQTMMAFALPNDGNYFTGNSVWTIRLNQTASSTTSAGVNGLEFIGPGYLALGAGQNERMRITSSGDVVIGATTASGKLHVESTSTGDTIYIAANTGGTAGQSVYVIPVRTAGTLRGGIQWNGSNLLYNNSSDARLKDNVADADDAASLIDAIQVRKFDWKESGTHQRYGFIAQELVEVAPEAVHQPEDEEEMMGVDYSKLVPMLVKEVQSLRARVAQLEGK